MYHISNHLKAFSKLPSDSATRGSVLPAQTVETVGNRGDGSVHEAPEIHLPDQHDQLHQRAGVVVSPDGVHRGDLQVGLVLGEAVGGADTPDDNPDLDAVQDISGLDD